MSDIFEITGIWSGPQNPAGDYTRLCHREYVDEYLAKQIVELGSIRFTDGTMLYLKVRKLEYDESPNQTKDGYGKLIRDCISAKVDSVAGLYAPAGETRE